MTNTNMTGRLEMRWVPVTTTDGRQHMEAVWVQISAPAVLSPLAA